MESKRSNSGEMLLYRSADGDVRVECLFQNETIWLTQKAIAVLFGVQRPAITKHLGNIFETGELHEKVVSSILEQTTQHGAISGKTQTKPTKYYNLDAIIAVGYRVNSYQATQFRIWATKTLKEFITKGFVLDDERLKQGGQMDGYVRLFEDRFKVPGDNPTIGLILCSDKSEAVAKYSVLSEGRQIFASKYLQVLPSEQELKLEIEKERRSIEVALTEKADL